MLVLISGSNNESGQLSSVKNLKALSSKGGQSFGKDYCISCSSR